MKRLLVLRPQPGADATAARAAALGFAPVVVPLFTVRALAWQAPEAAVYDAVLMTSANAARHGGAQLARFCHMPLFAVGTATGRAAGEAGFETVIVGDSDGAAALDAAYKTGHRRILHLAGREHVALDGADQRIVYASEPSEVAVPDADIALLHSPRAAQRFAELVTLRDGIAIAALSLKVASAAGPGWREVVVAERPDDESLLAAAAELCDQDAAGDEDPA